MKDAVSYYIKIFLYTTLIILFTIASYNIIINIRHIHSLSGNIVVSEADSKYSLYKNNVNKLEENISNSKDKNSQEYLALSKVLNSMKKDGVFRLIPKTKLSYHDLYYLNDYYIEELINNNWVNSIINLEISQKYQNTITILMDNANYLNSIFNSNSLNLYDGRLSNKLDDNYHFILSNYLMYSNVLLDICNELGWNDV